MDDSVREILEQVERGELSPEEAEEKIARAKRPGAGGRGTGSPGGDTPGGNSGKTGTTPPGAETSSGTDLGELSEKIVDTVGDFIDRSARWLDSKQHEAQEKMEEDRRELDIPLEEDWKVLSLNFTVRAGQLELSADAADGTALEGTFVTPASLTSTKEPSFSHKLEHLPEGGGRLKVSHSAGSGTWRTTGALPLRLALELSAGSAELDLTGATPERLILDTAASNLRVLLDEGAGGVDIVLDADASSVRLELPDSLGAEIKLTGSLSNHNLKQAGFQERGELWVREGESPITVTGGSDLSMLHVSSGG